MKSNCNTSEHKTYIAQMEIAILKVAINNINHEFFQEK